MRKITLLFVLLLYVVSAFGSDNGPALCGIGWIAWHNKDDFGATPYENKQYTVYKAPATWNPVKTVDDFDATWDLLGDTNLIALPTNIAGGDLFDLGTGNTFGAAWKAVHDGSKMYVLLKYFNIDEQVTQTSLSFEIMAQPISPVRHEPSFKAASDSAENFVKVYKNQAYARMVELGGGKAVFANGAAAQYEAARGTHRALHAGQQYWRSNQWVNNEFGLMALLDLADEGLMFWETADGVIRAVFPMDFAGVLSYPEDPAGDIVDGSRIALKEGDTFAFDVKSNALKGDAKVEYFWSANNNDGYGANYYSGHVTISPNVIGEEPGADIAITGINWIGWHNKDDWGTTPYDNKKYTVYKAPAAWAPVKNSAEFDATWNLLGEQNNVAFPTNTAGGDLFDIGAGNTFGSAWKAVHDGEIIYVLLKYHDVDQQVDQTSLSFEIMAQPTSPVRHEPTFQAGKDSTENVKAYQNQAYARVVELGGGKAVFKDGVAAAYEAAKGTHRIFGPAWAGEYWQSGQWVNNEFAVLAMLDLIDDGKMFWEKTDGVIRAVFAMDFAGVLSYPANPAGDIVEGPRVALKVGDTFAFDVKSNAAKGDAKIEYFWSANNNDGYGANYYSGHLTISDELVEGETPGALTITGINWIGWHNKDDWGTTPYDNKTYTVKKAPATWSPVKDNTAFDATWNLLGEQNNVAFPTNVAGGNLFDLGAGNTFGSAWKAVHDGEIMYALLKYYDVDQQVDQTSLSFEIMAQPASPVRHEPTYKAGKDSTENAKAYQNQAYARVVELGGGKAVFKDGVAAAYEAAKGTHRIFGPAWAGEYWQSGQWVNNEFAVLAMLDLIDDGKMYWDKTDGVIRAVFAMDFAGVLSYPADPAGDIVEGPRVALKVGDTFAFDVKSNAAKGDAKIEYFWSANNNDGYGANYYSGHLTISSQVIIDATNVRNIASASRINVYVFDQVLHVTGDQPVDLEIYNLLGARVKSAQNINQLPVSDLNNGIYIVRINGERNAYKVVKY